MSDNNSVLIYGFDSDKRTIQKLPIKFGAVQVSSVNSPASVDALNDNLFRTVYSIQDVFNPATVNQIVLENQVGSGKIIQVLKILVTPYDISGSIPTISGYGGYLASCGLVSGYTPVIDPFANIYSVLNNSNVLPAGVNMVIATNANATSDQIIGSSTFLNMVQGAAPESPANFGALVTNDSFFVQAGQSFGVSIQNINNCCTEIDYDVEYFFKLIDV